MSARRSAVLLYEDFPSQIVLVPAALEELLRLAERLYGLSQLVVSHETNGQINSQEAYDRILQQPGSLCLKLAKAPPRASTASDYALGFTAPHAIRLCTFSPSTALTLESEELDWSGRVCLYQGAAVLFAGGLARPRGATVFSIPSWTPTVLGDMATGRVWHGLVAVCQGAFAIGGKDPATGVSLKSVERLDSTAWVAMAALNFPRESLSVTTNRDLLYAVGGFDGLQRLQSVEVHKRGKWVMLPVRLPEPRQMAGLVWLDDTKLMVVGGQNDRRPKSTVFLLYMDTGKVEKMAPLPVPDYFAGKQLVRKANGEVCGFGRYSYVYLPEIKAWVKTPEYTRTKS